MCGACGGIGTGGEMMIGYKKRPWRGFLRHGRLFEWILFFDFFVSVVIGFERIEAIVVFVITTKCIGFAVVVVIFD